MHQSEENLVAITSNNKYTAVRKEVIMKSPHIKMSLIGRDCQLEYRYSLDWKVFQAGILTCLTDLL